MCTYKYGGKSPNDKCSHSRHIREEPRQTEEESHRTSTALYLPANTLGHAGALSLAYVQSVNLGPKLLYKCWRTTYEVPVLHLAPHPTDRNAYFAGCGMRRSLRPRASLSPRFLPPSHFGWQVLGQVEAHINALRAQLKNETPGVSALNDDGGPYPRGEEESARFPSPGGRQRPGHPAVISETTATDEVRCEDGTAINSGVKDTTAGTTAVPPLSMETRGNYHLSPIPTERSGNEGGLTEIEDMRLNRLLRTSKSSASSTPPPPSGECMTWQRGAINDGGSGGMPGSGDRLATVMADHQVGGVLAGDIGDVSRELFGTSPTPGNGDRGGTGWVREKNAFVASRRNRSIIDDEEDDLDDISDGGFHSGCWRRKYVRGEMR